MAAGAKATGGGIWDPTRWSESVRRTEREKVFDIVSVTDEDISQTDSTKGVVNGESRMSKESILNVSVPENDVELDKDQVTTNIRDTINLELH